MRNLKTGICSFCEVEKGIVAKGLCKACYQRKQKTGSLEYKRTGRNTCSVKDCNDFVVSYGLCDKHRQRLRKNGSIEQTRPNDWGERERHSLYSTWSTRRRTENMDLCEEWHNDFWLFVSDVSERPSSMHVLSRKDNSKLYSKKNYQWIEQEIWPVNKEERSLLNASKAKKWRKDYPDKEQNGYLKSRYNITYDHFNDLATKQGNTCAICNNPEKAINKHTGKPRRLAVDHCHDSGKIRGLLCTYCNTAIGSFNDDIDLLQSAIKYLKDARKNEHLK